MEADTLFENHTIKEIQGIEKKLRNDIESKKEELRQMVGERYRDLMEAADTITEMKQIAKNVANRIDAMETSCQFLEKSSLKSGLIKTVKNKVTQRKRSNENLYAIAALTKILMDSPAKVWRYIEVGDYLHALLLYVLARHTHATLVLDPFYTSQNILPHFPVISKQWASIRHFQHLLLQKSKEVLLSEDITDEAVVGPLCCLLFLSDISFEQVLEEFLSNRTIVILNIFKPEKSAKSQICELVDVLQTTLKIIHSLFYPETIENSDLKTNLLLYTISQITKKDSPGPVELLDKNSPTFPYLTKSIIAYKPSLKIELKNYSIAYLQRVCNDWILQVKTKLQDHLKELLKFVSSIKGLALIKEAVAERLQMDSEWNLICNHLLDQLFSVWGYVLRETFIERIKEVINTCLQLASRECIVEMDGTNQNKDTEDIPFYIWSESESDLESNLGWVNVHQRKLWEGGTLGVKAHALTPNIQRICKSLNEKLGSLLEDISYFHLRGKPGNISKLDFYSSSPQDMQCSIDTSEDLQLINDHLTNLAKEYFLGVADHFGNLMKSFGGPEGNENAISATRLIVMGHLCQGITKLCPNLVQCLLLNSAASNHMTLSPNPSKSDQLWQSVKSRFIVLSDQAFSIWSKQKVTNIVQRFDEEFVVCSVPGILKSLLEWDKIEIMEESEEGNSVKSILRIPQQISVPLYNALFSFCWQMNSVGGHALSSHVKFEIQESFFLSLMQVYERKSNLEWPQDIANSHLAQTQCLQLYFDVQFLMGLIGENVKSNDEVLSIAKVILEKVVSSIDPFDMDVFSPYIQANLKHSIQKCLLLLGLCIPQEQFGHLSSFKASSSSSRVEHSLMLMPRACSRFPLLPFASQPPTALHSNQDAAKKLNSSLQASPMKISSSHSSSPNLTSPENIANVLKSSSFYDRVTAMSSSWFGGN